MPLYVFDCPNCGPFELLLPLRESGRKRARCTGCERYGSRAASLTTMRPDTYWAGHVHRNYGYVTSETQLKAEMARRNHVPIGDRTDREAWEKIADNARKDKDEKMQKDVRGWSERTFGPSGLGLGGADGEKFIKEHS